MIIEPRLLVTRFAPHAERLANSLNDIGFFSLAQPLLTVTALDDAKTLNTFLSGYYDYVIAVSGNAVKYAQQQININWPEACYFAVGQSTQNILSEVTGQRVLCPFTRFDSEGLLELDELKSIKTKRILILRGEGGRDLLETTLIERGAKVDFFQTYKRIKIDLNGHELVNNWQQASINGAIISSVEILNQLFSLVPKDYTSWICDLIFYVPSERVANQASLLGAQHIVLLPSLHTDQIVEFFKVNNGTCI
ncbi:uroporphyrinogen-III synthase [uncultured Psychromonas sp.]|uniref:uroporphyrinogen-III synthase n=1 Tax=uncultured Psychromonas sp. TaxID=173974 RepID=UPI002609B530|nr:uroporphyrinogen-III synthase [uncultured Psychromonas sp.]